MASSSQHTIRPGALAAITLTGVLASGVLGGTTNAINAFVSPHYFLSFFRWIDAERVWRASVAQGVFEGMLFGVAFSLVFTIGTGIITEASCSFAFAFRHMLGILGGSLICWTFGGGAAMALATISPEFFRRTFVGVPDGFEPMIRFAWVGGSIWGVEIGGFVSVVVGLVILRSNWRWLWRVQRGRELGNELFGHETSTAYVSSEPH